MVFRFRFQAPLLLGAWRARHLVSACILILFTAGPANAETVTRFAYAINASDSSISNFVIDAATGILRHNGHVYTGKFPSHIVSHPNGRYVYAVAQTGMTISTYQVNSQTGRLTELEDRRQRMGIVSPARIAMDPNGEYMYVAGRNSNNIAGLRIDSNTGSIETVPGSPYPGNGQMPRSIVMHPSGRFVYLVNIVTDNIMAYAIDRDDGSLNEVTGAPFKTGRAPEFMIFTPDGRFAFLTNWMTHQVQRFAVDLDSGTLRHLGDVRTGMYPFDLNIDSSGSYLYVGCWGDNNVWVYTVDAKQGGLEPVKDSPFINSGVPTVSVALAPDQRNLYATNYKSNDISRFTVGSDGGLVLADRVTARVAPRNMAFINGKKPVQYVTPHAYVLDVKKKQLVRLQVDGNTGRLSVAGREPAGESPTGLAIGAQGEALFVLDAKQQGVARYSINTESGELTELKQDAPIKTGKGPSDIAVDYNSQFMYVSNSTDNTLSVYWIDKAELVEVPRTRLFEASPYPMEPAPTQVLVHPSGRYSYVLSAETGKVSVNMYYEDGPLNIPNDKPVNEVGVAVEHIAVSPSGNFLMALSPTQGQVGIFQIHQRTGDFVPMPVPRRAVGGKPVAIAFSPDERFVYILDASNGRIQPFELDSLTGKLSKIAGGVAAGSKPSELQLDAAGKYLYAVSAKGVIMTYQVDPASGDLKVVDTLSVGGELMDLTLRSVTE